MSHDLQMEIRFSDEMACATVVNDSGVDPTVAPPLRSKAVNSESKKKVNAYIVAPPLIHSSVTPSQKNSQRYDWMPKFYFLRKHIAPKMPPIGVFSLSSKKEAGDVDFGDGAEKHPIKEDAVDPASWQHHLPMEKQKTVTATARQSSLDHRLSPPLGVKGEKALPVSPNKKNAGLRRGGHEDEVFITKKQVDSAFYHDRSMDDSVIYDYSGSHSVDAAERKCNVDEERDSCRGFASPVEVCHTVARVHSDIFSDSADAPSSATDAPEASGQDWKPQEAHRILSDIYDLGDACICTMEDGCICYLDLENGSPDSPEENMLRKERTTGKQGSPKPKPAQSEGHGETALDQQSRPGGRTSHNRRRQEGTSIDLHFHQSSIHSGVDQLIATTFERRKNTRLSDRIICKRRFSPSRFETGVDPRGMDLAETLADSDTNREFAGAAGGLQRSPVRKENSEYADDYKAASQSTVVSNVDAAVASRSSTVDTMSTAESSADDWKINDCSSAVDEMASANLQPVHVSASMKSSAVDDGASSIFSDSDANVVPCSPMIQTDTVEEYPATDSGSYNVDDGMSYRSSAVDNDILSQPSFVSADVMNSTTDIDINKDAIYDELRTPSSVVGREVTKHFSEIGADNMTLDGNVVIPSGRLQSVDLSETSGDAEISTGSMSVKAQPASKMLDVSNEAALDTENRKSPLPGINEANTDNNDINTMENARETYLRVQSPQIYSATKVHETAHQTVTGIDFAECLNQNEESIVLDNLESELTEFSTELVQEACEEDEDDHPNFSPARESHSDLEIAEDSNHSLNVQEENVKDTTKLPDASSQLKTPPGRNRISRIPKPVCAKHAEMYVEKKKETGGDSLAEPSLDSLVGDSQKSKSASGTEIIKLSPSGEEANNQFKPAARGKSADKVSPRLKVISVEDNTTKVYSPQVITFYTYRDGKAVTTIPPPLPKIHKTEKTPPLPNLPPWNTSTLLEKNKKYTKPAPLHSKRNTSSQSLISSASESSKRNPSNQILVSSASETSKHSLGEAKTATSIDRIAARMSTSVTGDNRTGIDSGKHVSSQRKVAPTRQPFRPAGLHNEGEKKILVPAKNSARSHPDLRVPGGPVEIPVHYPSMTQSGGSSTAKSTTTKTGTKRTQQEKINVATIPDKNVLYPHSMPWYERGVNENCNSAVSVCDGSGQPQDFPLFSFSAGELFGVLGESGSPKFAKRIRFDRWPSLEEENRKKEEGAEEEREDKEENEGESEFFRFANNSATFGNMSVSSSQRFFAQCSLPSDCTSKIPVPYKHKESSGRKVRALGTFRSGKSGLPKLSGGTRWHPGTRQLHLSSFPLVAQFQPSVGNQPFNIRTRAMVPPMSLLTEGKMVVENYQKLPDKMKND